MEGAVSETLLYPFISTPSRLDSYYSRTRASASASNTPWAILRELS